MGDLAYVLILIFLTLFETSVYFMLVAKKKKIKLQIFLFNGCDLVIQQFSCRLITVEIIVIVNSMHFSIAA